MSKEAVLKTIQDLLSKNAEQSAIKESLIQSLIDYTNVKGTFIVPVHADEDGGNLPVLFEDANKNPYLLAYTTSEQFQDSPEFESKNKTIEMTVDALAKHILMRADLFGMILDLYGDSCRLSCLDLWRILEDNDELPSDIDFRNAIFEKACSFALSAHRGQVRKGTGDPFITHPMEVMAILNSMNLISVDPNVVIAGILHDVVEDTSVEIYEIAWHFGHDVAMLVQSHTEDKTKSWQERKEQDIEDLKSAGVRVKMLIMADLLANLRSMSRDWMQIGEELWSRFKAPKEKQTWYYKGMIDALEDMQQYTETAPVYWELRDRYNQLFLSDSSEN